MKTMKAVAILWFLQVVGNAALLVLFAWWLNWPDSNFGYLTAAALTALVMAFAALWLHCGTLAYFSEPAEGAGSAFRHAVGRLPAFLLWAAVVAAALWGVQWLKDYLPQASVRFAQILHLSPRTVMKIGEWKLFGLQWIVLPALFWPFAFNIAGRGFRGWHPRALGFLRRWKYWLGLATALGLGILVPYKLIWWPLGVGNSLAHETLSMRARFGAAYLLCVTCWLVLAVVMRTRENASAEGDEEGH